MRYILIVVLFYSCSNPFRRQPPPVSMEPLDTIKSAPAAITAVPALFENAFIKGTTLNVNNKTVYFYGVTIGNLKIVSGRIAACDPLHIDEYGIPFTQNFPTGEFPVQLSIGRLNDKESVAFARINFSDEPVQKWEFALQPGQKPLPVGGDKMHGYSVDGGVGIFIDDVASKVLDKAAVEDFESVLFKEMDKHYRNDWKYTMYGFGSHNLAAFSSGFGDGYYPTYIGFDASGKPCRLLTDFGLFEWREAKK